MTNQALNDHLHGQGEPSGLQALLDIYEAETKALPVGHEIPWRGCSTYNWRMSIIRDLREMSALIAGAAK